MRLTMIMYKGLKWRQSKSPKQSKRYSRKKMFPVQGLYREGWVLVTNFKQFLFQSAIFPARMVYLGSAENCNLESATMVSYMQVPTWQGKGDNFFMEKKRKLGGFPGGSVSKESSCNAGDLGLTPGSRRFPWRRKWERALGYSWLFVGWVLARKDESFLLLGSAVLAGCESAPCWYPNSI